MISVMELIRTLHNFIYICPRAGKLRLSLNGMISSDIPEMIITWLLGKNAYGDLGESADIQNGDDDPVEYLTYTNSGINETLVQIGVFRQSGDGKTLEIFTYTSNGSYTFLDNLVASDSIYGHPAVPDVVAVGAVRAADPGNDDIEWFSSLGPVSITYPSPVSRAETGYHRN